MSVKIYYWTASGVYTWRIVASIETQEDLDAAIKKLVDDPRRPLAQYDRYEIVQDMTL